MTKLEHYRHLAVDDVLLIWTNLVQLAEVVHIVQIYPSVEVVAYHHLELRRPHIYLHAVLLLCRYLHPRPLVALTPLPTISRNSTKKLLPKPIVHGDLD